MDTGRADCGSNNPLQSIASYRSGVAPRKGFFGSRWTADWIQVEETIFIYVSIFCFSFLLVFFFFFGFQQRSNRRRYYWSMTDELKNVNLRIEKLDRRCMIEGWEMPETIVLDIIAFYLGERRLCNRRKYLFGR